MEIPADIADLNRNPSAQAEGQLAFWKKYGCQTYSQAPRIPAAVLRWKLVSLFCFLRDTNESTVLG